MITTIGHGSRPWNDFITLLKYNQIQVLVDVRTYPYSKYHTHYRKNVLETSLRVSGIEYVFLGDQLGGRPRNIHTTTNGSVDYEILRRTQAFQDGVMKIIDYANQKIKVTLMCSEGDPNSCHRKHLIGDELVKRGVPIWHINRHGLLEMHELNFNASLFD